MPNVSNWSILKALVSIFNFYFEYFVCPHIDCYERHAQVSEVRVSKVNIACDRRTCNFAQISCLCPRSVARVAILSVSPSDCDYETGNKF